MLGMEYAAAVWFYAVFSAFAFVGLPFTRQFIASRSLAWAAAKPVGLMLCGYVIWLLGSLHVLDYQSMWLISATIALAVCWGAYASRTFFTEAVPAAAKKEKKKRRARLPFYKKILLVEAVTFLLYAAYLYLRSYNAGINGTERFMDMMLLTAAGHTHYFPFIDSWYAGKTINYYYYGSYLMSVVSNIAHVPYALSYTFSLGILYCESALLSAALVFAMTRSVFFSAAASFLVTTAGTVFFAISTIHAAASSQIYSYASSTRLYTPSYIINEIPSYSFTVGDMHAHVLALPFFLLGLVFLYTLATQEQPRPLFLAMLALSMATSGMINLWDIVTLASLLAVLVITKIMTAHKYDEKIRAQYALRVWMLSGAGTIAAALLLMLPDLIYFQSPVLGIGFAPLFVAAHQLTNVQYPTPLLAELGMWGIYVGGIAYALWKKRGDCASCPFIITLGVVSLGIIIGVELFFIKDIYSITNPPYFRANTTFKFGYHAWVMLCIAFAALMATLTQSVNDRKRAAARRMAIALTAAALGAGIFYPYQAIKQFYLPSTDPHDLNGAAWMQFHSAEDLAAIAFINTHVHERAVIAEAVGDSYSWYGRMSAFTGMITPMGWKSHEWTWRFQGKAAEHTPRGVTVETGWGPISAVAEDIQHLYEATSTSAAQYIIKKYGIRYVYIGDMERTMYPNIQEHIFEKIGTLVFQKNRSRLFQVAFQ